MNDRILADEELDGIDKIAIDGDLVPYLQAQDAKTANYYETVIIPERERKLIEEIERDYGDPDLNKWLEQLKQKRGK